MHARAHVRVCWCVCVWETELFNIATLNLNVCVKRLHVHTVFGHLFSFIMTLFRLLQPVFFDRKALCVPFHAWQVR